MPLISPPDRYSLWGTMTSDKSWGHSWMNYSLLARRLIHPSRPTCKLKLGNVRFRAEILNNCTFLTRDIDSPWFFASDRWLGFGVNRKSILVTVHRTQGRLTFLGVLSTDINYHFSGSFNPIIFQLQSIYFTQFYLNNSTRNRLRSLSADSHVARPSQV